MLPVDYLPAARRDFDESFDWYAERSLSAALGFVDSVDAALSTISADTATRPAACVARRPSRQLRQTATCHRRFQSPPVAARPGPCSSSGCTRSTAWLVPSAAARCMPLFHKRATRAPAHADAGHGRLQRHVGRHAVRHLPHARLLLPAARRVRLVGVARDANRSARHAGGRRRHCRKLTTTPVLLG